jgi:nucleoside-diphosphate-sugar epimerase
MDSEKQYFDNSGEGRKLSFWHDKKVFVTGATGLLGSWMVETLLNEGATVTCLVRDWAPGSKLISSGTASRANIVHGGLEDYELLLRIINEYEIDSVFHLAAQTIVGTASRSAISTFESNIRGTWNLLEACRVCPKLIERIIFASSDKAYGAHDNLPYTEDMALQGRFPYDVSKSCADLIAQSYFHSYRMPVAITRCVNLFGGGDLSFNRLVPGTIASALRNERPVIRSNGKFVRDYRLADHRRASLVSSIHRAGHGRIHTHPCGPLGEQIQSIRGLKECTRTITEMPLKLFDRVQTRQDAFDFRFKFCGRLEDAFGVPGLVLFDFGSGEGSGHVVIPLISFYCDFWRTAASGIFYF